MANRNKVPAKASAPLTGARKRKYDEERMMEERRRNTPKLERRDPRNVSIEAQRTSIPEFLISKLPSESDRNLARMVTHGIARTGNTILRTLDIPNRIFGNTRSLLQDIYEKSEANLARDAYEGQNGVHQVGETAVHLASAGILGKALPAVFGANVGVDTYETAKYAGASEGEALAKGIGHGVVDTAIWTLGQGLASKYLPKAWQWLGRELTGAMRGAASSVTSDAVLNSLGADISGEEMAKRAAHAAWMVPLLGMLKMGGKRREEAMALIRKARPDLTGKKADNVIEMIETEFSDPKSQKIALAWVARKGANLPDDTAQIKQALEVVSKVKGLDPMSRSPFEILSNPAYARYLPKPKPQDVKAFSNMKRYPMGVIGFDVSDDAAGRQATREMINAYMSPSSNPWCLATGKDAAKLGELGPGAEGYWKSHSAVPKQIFFQEVGGKLELTAFRATSQGGEGQQEYWDTSDAGYSGIPLKVKVPGDPMGRYRKMVFRPGDKGVHLHGRHYSDRESLAQEIAREELHLQSERSSLRDGSPDYQDDLLYVQGREAILAEEREALRNWPKDNNEVQGTFEDIAPGMVFKGSKFADGKSQAWVQQKPVPHKTAVGALPDDLLRDFTELGFNVNDPRDLLRYRDAMVSLQGTYVNHETFLNDLRRLDKAIAGTSSGQASADIGVDSYVLVEETERTTENGITKFRTTKYAYPTDWDYEPPKPGESPKPVEIEESELVSPEWMRSRGYDPDSESDVHRMHRELNLQGWGDGAEAAMAVVPTRRTYMQTKSGTPETVTYGPNGRDVVSVDFEKNGVPYRHMYFASGPSDADPSSLYRTIDYSRVPSVGYIYGSVHTGSRLIRNPDSASPEVLDEIKWDEGLGSFVRTSGNRRWRFDPDFLRLARTVERQTPVERARAAASRARLEAGHVVEPHFAWPGIGSPPPADLPQHLLPVWERAFQDRPPQPRWIVEDRQPDGTWTPVEVRGLPSPSPTETPPTEPPPTEPPLTDDWPDPDEDLPFALRAAEGAGDTNRWTWGNYRWNPGAKGGQRIDPGNIKGTGIAFDERDRAVLPESERKAYEKWMDELADPKGEWELENGKKVKVRSELVPKDWRTNKEFDRDYDYVRAYLAGRKDPELAWRMVGPVWHDKEVRKNGEVVPEGYWLHMNDVGKMPTHPTFSTDSLYAKDPELAKKYIKLAGSWSGEEYIPGEAEKSVQQAEGAGDTEGPDMPVEKPIPQATEPVPEGGPRIVINPEVFEDKRDALCVAMNEAFRILMEVNGFNPVSEPTDAQRQFFADTAYSQNENQMRRTILARICTFDTSVKDPTEEQLEESVEFLEAVMEMGAPQNEWEQQAVQRIHDVLVAAIEKGTSVGNTSTEEPPAPEEDGVDPSGSDYEEEEIG